MSQEKQNSPRPEVVGLPNADSHSQLDFTAPSACEHLAAARHWLTIAENNWTDSDVCRATAKLAEIHVMLADRVADLGACDV